MRVCVCVGGGRGYDFVCVHCIVCVWGFLCAKAMISMAASSWK